MGWIEFVAAFAAFFLSHSLPLRPPVRAALRARLGRRGFGLAYSALSLAVLAWLIGAAARAPHVPLWDWAPWQNVVVIAVMLAVCLLLALALGRPNPLSFGGAWNDRFDPTRPGIVRWTRHPVLTALALWSAAHLLANGDLAHVALFGTFAGFSLLGMRLVDRRKRADMGPDWTRLVQAVRAAPRSASWRGEPRLALRLGLGLALYAALLWAHPLLFGVDPLA
ncbi:NnrU family protein [Maliponia aquimaris]|uniref:NnrU protein n=1 Tax=Maliponia aquimaris TaxID=1673631 RepID=A0A238L7I9_9RHOB|nr:NnrU family protein [Maliponia aquimaris]SMX50800.1 NnrU protein [Maliponia aquimaris]